MLSHKIKIRWLGLFMKSLTVSIHRAWEDAMEAVFSSYCGQMEGLTIFPCDVWKGEEPFHEREVGTWVEWNNYLELLWVGQEYSYHLHDRVQLRSHCLHGEKAVFWKWPRKKEKLHCLRSFLKGWVPEGTLIRLRQNPPPCLPTVW